MTSEEKLAMQKAGLKKAEFYQEECRINYLLAQAQVVRLQEEIQNGSDVGAGNKPPASK